MLGDLLPERIEGLDYEYVRAYLFLYSTGFRRLVKSIRDKYSLAGVSSEEVDKHCLLADSLQYHAESELWEMQPDILESIVLVQSPIRGEQRLLTYRALGLDINRLSQRLSLSKTFIQLCVAHPPMRESPLFYLSHSLPVFSDPESMEGFFIKVDWYTKKDTVIEAWKFIKRQLKNFEATCDKPPKKSGIQMRYRSPERQELLEYLVIENKLEELASKKDGVLKRSDCLPLIESSVKFAIRNFLSEETMPQSTYQLMRKNYMDLLNIFEIPKIWDFDNS